jgi:hypothetical protein
MFDKYKLDWKNRVSAYSQGDKLRTYKLFKHEFCTEPYLEYIKNEYYFFIQFVSNPSNYTVKSNFLFRHGPFAFPGKGGGVDGWHDMNRFSLR